MSAITYRCGDWISSQGRFRAGRPWGRVIHTLECEARPGVARALSERGGYLDSQNLAPQRMTDPAEVVHVLPTNTVGGHCGPRGNPLLVGYEVSGRAMWSAAQWVDGGLAQRALENDARIIAEDCINDGWTRDEIRWLSGAQIQQNYNGGSIVRGLLEHNDVSEFIGGTSHWDPGPGFPSGWFEGRIKYNFDQLTGGLIPKNPPVDPPIDPGPGPTPTPTPGTPNEDDDMVRLVLLDGETRRLCADFGARTFWHVGRQDQYDWMRDKLGIPELGGVQAPMILDGFREIEAAPWSA